MEQVEVFKTNVETGEQARQLVHLIHENFPYYTVNFDLEDCDKILRVKSIVSVLERPLIDFIQRCGFDAAVLTDEIPPFAGVNMLLSATKD